MCAARSIRRVAPKTPTADIIAAAAEIAVGFQSLFNRPEATAIIQDRDDDAFWRRCLGYCLDGNLQAVLDEYAHMLAEWRPFDSDPARELGERMSSALTLRTSAYRVDTFNDSGTITRRTMRGHYAIRFGDGRSEDDSALRVGHVSDAFNSPFWPFVLASTSIGQEGLDFHLYCHAVVHWNLPHNPVDLEQREGRVHRFKGHAIRKNVASVCGLQPGGDDPWRAMFAAASQLRPAAESEIMPYWVFNGDTHVERHLLVPPFTRDASHLPDLLRSAAIYRLAFGQPRQEDFLRTLSADLDDTQRAELTAAAIDLQPPI